MKSINQGKTGSFFTMAVLVLSGIGLSGCEMYAPGNLSTEKIQVQQDSFFSNIPANQVDDLYISGLARHYNKHGDQPMKITVTYDPKNYRNSAMKANQRGLSIVRRLRAKGVRDIKMDILPVTGQGDVSRVLVSYDSYTALAPEGCTTMPGVEDKEIEPDKEYKLGCTIDTLLAKQVARPKDLAGRANEDTTTDGRSATNIVDVYRSGAKNEKLDGESASGK